MTFHLYKGGKDDEMGIIRFRYWTIAKENEKSQKLKISLGIEVSVSEWETYKSGEYNPSEEMSSLGITYSKFGKFLDMVEETINMHRQDDNIRFYVQSAMMKLIADNCNNY